MKSLKRKIKNECSSVDVSYPSISVELKQMPQLKGKDVGDEISLVVKAKIKGISKYGDGDTNYSLDLVEYKVKGMEEDKDE